jgi:ABC-type branched-subunit amino acid transport system ATPase component
MAAILKLRRGTSFTSLQESEFFYDRGLETVLIGDGSGSNTGHKTLVKLTELNSGSIYLNGDVTGSHISASGNITASSLKLSGDADIVGNITLGGDIFLGDGTNATDNINVNASFSGSLIPTTTDVFTIGSVSKKIFRFKSNIRFNRPYNITW